MRKTLAALVGTPTDQRRSGRGLIAAVAGVILGVLLAQLAIAGDSDGGKVASLQRQINQLRAQVANGQDAITSAKSRRGPRGPRGARGPAGPPGAPGAPGSATACEGNGSGDQMVAAGAACIDKYEVS